MLKQSSIFAANPVAEFFADRNLRLTPVDNTPLMDLSVLSYSAVTDLTESEMTVTEYSSALMAGSMTKDLSGVPQHDITMDELVTVAKGSVTNMLQHAKTVAMPVVNEIYSDADALITSYISTANRHSIQTDFLESIFDNQIFLGFIEKYADVAKRHTSTDSHIYPELTGEQLLKMLSTGITRVDADVEKLLAALPDRTLMITYNNSFRGILDASIEVSERVSAVITYLLARAFELEVPENTEVDLSVYKLATANIASQAGRAAFQAVAKRKLANDSRQLLLNIPHPSTFNDAIVVNGEVYNRWLKDGGTPEILLGMTIRGDRITNYDTLLKLKDELEGAYQRNERLQITAASANKLSLLKDSTYRAMATYIRSLDEDVNTAVLFTKLRNGLDAIPANENTVPFDYVRKVVCEVFYSHTKSLLILEQIDRICAADKTVEPREAATLVVIDVVCDWIVSQMEVSA